MRTAAPSRIGETVDLYSLSTGEDIATRNPFPSPLHEYRDAFADPDEPFLYYYRTGGAGEAEQLVTRGEFWNRAVQTANYLAGRGLSKGDRIVHCFSQNCPDDLAFRLASVLTGCVPVTINWQADDDDTIVYKATVTGARLLIYDCGFANRMEKIKTALPGAAFLAVEDAPARTQRTESDRGPGGYGDERIIIFTAGTTGKPKGVILSGRSLLANRLTFDGYFGLSASQPLDLLLVNPLHHTNSSALSDWALRRRGAVLHLVQRYATSYWRILAQAVRRKRGLLVAPLVPRHIDFLDNLITARQLPLPEAKLREAMGATEILIGSAPVGPTTVRRILEISGRTPLVRFGSTETCLEVLAIPRNKGTEDVMAACEAGWNHRIDGRSVPGYYIGRPHFPFTRVKIVKGIVPGEQGYLLPCGWGEPGYLVTQGANIMSGYAGRETNTAEVFREGWYTGFHDIAFCLEGSDGGADYYWMARDSALLIRGGANYSCEQVAAALSRLIQEDFPLRQEQFRLAVTGLRIDSEHDDSCCVTIELGPEAKSLEPLLQEDFRKAAMKLPKGYRPDYVRFADIPTSFKGAVLVPKLKEEFEKDLKKK
jgi:fatty-acyl-CoA synthase